VIDFRYHLVSIVSIFLALAVGIVLGAGPLQNNIGQSLNEQVTALRQDKATLRAQLDAQKRGIDARDTFANTVTPKLVSGSLSGRTVSLVVAPGADADTVKKTTTALTGAGARIGSTVTLTDAWVDPTKRTFRDNLATQLASLVKAPGTLSTPEMLPGTVLARALLTTAERPTDKLDPSAAQALEGLKAGDLLTVGSDPVVHASSAVLVAGPVKGTKEEDTDARLASWVALTRALDAAGSGTVVTSTMNVTDPQTTGALVAAVRADGDASKAVSTVDDGDQSIGAAPLVEALTEQYAGHSGHYGVGSDAASVLPGTVK